MNQEKIHFYYARGLWPGPGETKEQYEERAQWQISKCSKSSLALSLEEKVKGILQSLYGFQHPPVDVSFSSKGLSLWEGAALFTLYDDRFTLASIHIRKEFLKGSFLFYTPEEVLSHEYFHAARIAYNCPRYEEIFAYKTSKSSFRRWLGPLFQSPLEGAVFICSICIGLIFQWFISLCLGMSIPLVILALLMIRLGLRHRRVASALSHITPLLKKSEDAFAVLCRLTDSEIEAFASQSSNEISRYIDQNRNKELRLNLLHDIFLK
jgi:hypothetical protein